MSGAAVQVQPVVRAKARSLGPAGAAWLDRLPGLVAELERRWSVQVVESLTGGTSAYVGLAGTAGGSDVVLKVSVPDRDFADEIGTLERAGDPAYDVGVALRDWHRQLLAADDPGRLARRYAGLLAAGCDIDAQEVWEWGYVERVSTGLYALAFGAVDLARPFFRTAELLLDA